MTDIRESITSHKLAFIIPLMTETLIGVDCGETQAASSVLSQDLPDGEASSITNEY